MRKLNIRRAIQYYFLRFKRLQGSPRSLALGTAIGAAIAITPTLPLHTVFIVAVTLLFRVNTIAALIAGAFISNPLTFVPQYYLAWLIGDFLFPHRLSWDRILSLLEQLNEEGLIESLKTVSHIGFDAFIVMMTGGVILAIPAGLIGYFLAFWFFKKLRLKRQQKHLLNNNN